MSPRLPSISDSTDFLRLNLNVRPHIHDTKMKPTHIVLIGLIFMLIGFITPRVVPSLAASLSIVFTLCYVVGLLMLIIGGIRASRAKKKD
jgi:hypothetical protein